MYDRTRGTVRNLTGGRGPLRWLQMLTGILAQLVFRCNCHANLSRSQVCPSPSAAERPREAPIPLRAGQKQNSDRSAARRQEDQSFSINVSPAANRSSAASNPAAAHLNSAAHTLLRCADDSV